MVNFQIQERNALFGFISSIDKYPVLTMEDLLRRFTNFDYYYKRFKNELGNNLMSSNEYTLKYIETCLEQLIEEFPVGVDISEYNFLSFYQNSKYKTRLDQEEYEYLSEYFERTTSPKGKEFLNCKLAGLKEMTVRKWALPYHRFGPERVDEVIQFLQRLDLLEDFHESVNRFNNPKDVINTSVREAFESMLVFTADIAYAEFLWLLIGLLFEQRNNLRKQTLKLNDIFKDKADIFPVLSRLRAHNVIDENNNWRGITLKNKFVKHRTAVLALVEVLDLKDYLQKSTVMSSKVTAFSLAFNIKLGKRSLTNIPIDHSIYMEYFESLIPERSKLHHFKPKD